MFGVVHSHNSSPTPAATCVYITFKPQRAYIMFHMAAAATYVRSSTPVNIYMMYTKVVGR